MSTLVVMVAALVLIGLAMSLRIGQQ